MYPFFRNWRTTTPQKRHLQPSDTDTQGIAPLWLSRLRSETRETGATQLFDLTPRGDDLDWSKDYRDAFGDVLDAYHFKAGQRPTAYSFRHTVADEHVVA